jgi:hypothetical protein
MATDRDAPSPAEQVGRLYEQTESEAAKATERLVGSGGFASLLGQLAENGAALTKLSGDALDLAVRNFRLAGRRDIIRLSRQIARTEDKLERVLQELETLRDQLDPPEAPPPASRAGARRAPASRGARRSNGASARQSKSSR